VHMFVGHLRGHWDPVTELASGVCSSFLILFFLFPLQMIGSVIGVYNGKTFNQVEIKPEMVGYYLAEFSISYKPCKHGRPGIGASTSSRFIPLK
jgi:small subunit ribosomal protein S15e